MSGLLATWAADLWIVLWICSFPAPPCMYTNNNGKGATITVVDPCKVLTKLTILIPQEVTRVRKLIPLYNFLENKRNDHILATKRLKRFSILRVEVKATSLKWLGNNLPTLKWYYIWIIIDRKKDCCRNTN